MKFSNFLHHRFLPAVIAAFLAVFASLSAQETKLSPDGVEKLIVPRGEWREFDFELPADLLRAGKQIRLELDGRVDFPKESGYCQWGAMIVLVNDREVAEHRLVNLPLEFRQHPRGSLETGEWHAFFQYVNAKSGPSSLERLKKRNAYAYELVYAPSIDSASAAGYLHRIPGYSRTRKVFDLTGLCREGKNTVSILNVIPESFVKILGDLSPLPIVLTNLHVVAADDHQKKPNAFWMDELIAQGKRREWVSPRKDWSEKFFWQVGKDGGLSIEVGGRTYRISSAFSTVGAQNGIPRLPNSEASWQPRREELPSGGVRITAKGGAYELRRDFVPTPLGLEVRDTIRNTGRDIAPVILRHRIHVPNPSAEAYIVGLRTWPGVDASAPLYFPENPTGYAGQEDGSGLGIAAYDDILRVHGEMRQIKDDLTLSDPHLALAPGKTVTLIWQLYPVAKGGYCEFINNVRHNWGMNKTGADFYGEYNHIFHPVPAGWRPRRGTHWVEVHHRWQEQPWWGLAQWRNEGLWQLRKEALDSLRREAPQLEVIASVMAMYFSNAGTDDIELFGDCAMVDKNGSYPSEIGARFFIPTLCNDFGRLVEDIVDRLLDMGYDGIYFDYMEGNINARFTYNQYDGVSGDVNPRSGRLEATKGAYQLLSQEFLQHICRKIAARGKKLYGNLNNQTTTNMYALRDLAPLRYSESLRAHQMSRGQLAPCPNALCRDSFSHRIHPMVLRALYEGMMTTPFEIYYPKNWPDDPSQAMWPIAYREMRRGVVIGEKKIITAVSGRYGFGDTSTLTARFFDAHGCPQPRTFPQLAKDGATYLDVELQPGEIVVVERQ